MPDPFRFSNAKLQAAKPPKDRAVTIRDTDTPGLAVTITPTGTKSLLWYGRIRGESSPVRVKIGRFPGVSVPDARTRAKKISADAATGINPNKAARHKRRAERDALTFGEAAQLFIDYKREVKQARTWAEDERKVDLHLKHWKNRKLADITTEDIDDLLRKIAAKPGKSKSAKREKGVPRGGKGAANRVRALLLATFNHARIVPNPCGSAIKFKEVRRDTYLRKDQLPAFVDACYEDGNPDARDVVLLALLTGARQGNLLSMRWDDIDLKLGKWRISAEASKSGHALTVALSPEAVGILEDRREACGSSPYVFPSHSATGHIVEIKSAWSRIKKRAGLGAFRFHDLRHSHASFAVAEGATLPQIGAQLGHRSTMTTSRYAHLTDDTARPTTNKTSAAIMQASGRGKPANGTPQLPDLSSLTPEQVEALIQALEQVKTTPTPKRKASAK